MSVVRALLVVACVLLVSACMSSVAASSMRKDVHAHAESSESGELVSLLELDARPHQKKLRFYMQRNDSSSRCDEAKGTIYSDVRNSTEARRLCDKQRKPPCAGYIWTGPIGIGRNASNTPTPFMLMTCAGMRQWLPTDVPGSKYETGVALNDYTRQPGRKGECSAASRITTKYDVMNSYQARTHCDNYDGLKGPKCLSYVWNIALGELYLCAGVPQGKLVKAEQVETSWQTPTSCAQMSNRWVVRYNESWGYAPMPVKKLYMSMKCTTSPTECQGLSDFYGLSPKLTSQTAARVPGSIRDLWLAQGCRTAPIGVARDRQKPQYIDIESGVAAIESTIDDVEEILARAAAKDKTEKRSKEMRDEVIQATAELESTLQRIQA